MELLTDEDLKELYIEQEVEAEMEKGEERTLLGATIQVPLPESQRGEVRTRIAEKVSNDPHASTKARDAIGKLDEKTLKESYQARFSPAAPSKSDDETAAEQEAYKRSYDAYNIGKQEQFLGVVPHAANGIPAAPVQPNKASPMEQIGKGLLNEMALNMVIPQMPDYYSKRMIETPLHYSRFTFQKFVIDPQMQMAELSFLFGAVAIVLVIPTGGTSMYLLAAAEVFLGVAGMVVSTQKMNDLKDGKAFTDPTFLGLNQRTIDILGVGMAGVALLSLMKHGVMKVANKLSNSKQITALDELEGLQRMTGGDIQVAPPASGKAAGKADGKQAGKLPPASGKLGSKTPEINAAPKVVPPKVLPGKAGSEGPLQKTRPEPVDDSKTSIMKETIRTRVLRNIANSKKARDASNFDVYLRNEKVLFDKIKGKNKLKENATGTDGSGNVPKRYGEPPVETKLKIDIAAEKKAELIRVSGLDNIEVFAKNTGLSIEEAKNLKSHMFLNEYELCHFDQQGLYYYKSRLTPDSEVVYAFTKAQEGELTQQGKEWFKKLAAHELAEKKLMESGLNYRHPDSWDGMKFTSDPPGAHDLAPKQPEFGSFPGYEEDVAKFYNIKWRELYD
ncbi:hypothetical protein [Paenibacillus plantiphilus]|nr:hypothetical protein [Paenibacillus plantiphilus]